jgi:GNAT superfamily N-acetyltransferase
LKDFAPPEWNTDISRQFALYFGQPYFHPIVAELAGKMVGCANGLLNQATGWLGNIIVLPEYRRQGIGSALTEYLVEYFLKQGCSSQVLVATKLGEPVYTKLGFTIRSTYTFLRSTRAILAKPTPHIRKVEPGDLEAIRELDREITREKRSAFLERFLAGGWVCQTDTRDQLAGFFLPDLASGPVIAQDADAGMELLQFKLGRGCNSVVVPSANQPALDFLLGAGFQVGSTAPRMTLGPELDWKPGGVFSRGSGYCG